MVAFIDQMIGQIAGKEIAVLGDRETGKTHLQYFLHTQTIPTEYKQTLGQQMIRAGVARLIVVDGPTGKAKKEIVRLTRTYDVPGSAEAIDSWKAVVQRAAILLYLFRADLVFHDDQAHLKRVQEDADALARILRGLPRKLRGAALVGTHYDVVPGFQGPEQGSVFYRWHAGIEENDTIKRARQALGAEMPARPALVVGSMKTLPQTRELLYRLFAQELRIGK